MTDAEIRAVVMRALGRIAPEVDRSALDTRTPLREQADLDSIDFTNFLIALADELGVDVPETDYAQLATLDGCVSYLATHGAAVKGTTT
jgi:acyl carrier protein